MTNVALLQCLDLGERGFTLVLCLPRLVGHTVDCLAAVILAQRHALCVRRVLQSVRQAIAAEPCKIHQVDILNIGAAAQMLDEPAKYSRFQFHAGLVVDAHGHFLGVCGKPFMGLYMGAVTQSAISPVKTSSDRPDLGGWPVDTNEALREINNQLIYLD